MSDTAWRDALGSARRLLAGDRGGARLFFERRDDARIAVSDGAVREWVGSRTLGLTARCGDFEVHCSDPRPEDAESLACAASERRDHPVLRASIGNRIDPPAERGIDTDAAFAIVLSASERLGRVHSAHTGIIGSEVRWVGLRQTALTVDTDRELRADVRRHARIRVAVRVAKGSLESYAVGDAVVSYDGVDATALADRVVGRAIERLDARPVKRGDQSVVFAAGLGGIFVHELVGHALEADTVLAGASALASASSPVAQPVVSVVDDPGRGRAAWRWDDEGEAPRAVALLEAGRVAGFLHDQSTARRAGQPVTGHGRRSSYVEPVRPRMGCTFLTPGPAARDDIIRETDRGIYVRRMESAGTDTSTGNAFFRVTDADRIHDGRLAEPLVPFLMYARGLDALRSLDRVADDLAFDTCIGACVRDGQPLATSVGAPTCRVRLISVFS